MRKLGTVIANATPTFKPGCHERVDAEKVSWCRAKRNRACPVPVWRGGAAFGGCVHACATAFSSALLPEIIGTFDPAERKEAAS
jgi:hypothetical protein